MRQSRRYARSIPLLLGTLLLAAGACSSSSDGGGGAGSGGPWAFGQPCGAAGCADGLYCAKDGFAAGLCTMDCTGSSMCSARFGSNAFCQDQCVQQCGAAGMTCAEGATCQKADNRCVAPTPAKTWACAVTGGICTCTADGKTSGPPTCPSQFYSASQYGCCSLGGPTESSATWNTCVCQLYTSIPAGGTCYDLPISLGINYGPEVQTCPDGGPS